MRFERTNKIIFFCGLIFYCVLLRAQSNSWEKMNFPILNPSCVEMISSGSGGIMLSGISATIGGYTYLSTDYGVTWRRNDPGLMSSNQQRLYGQGIFSIGKSIFLSNGSVLAVSNSTGYWLYKSTDNGDNWTDFNHLPAKDFTVDSNGILYTSSWWGGDGRWPGQFGMLVSSDSGTTWIAHPTPMQSGLDDGILSGLIHTTSKGIIVVAFSAYSYGSLFSYTFSSTDGGITWPFTSVTNSTNVYSITSTKNGNLFRAIGSEVQWSTNAGESWSTRNTGLPSDWPLVITVNSSDILFVGMENRGVWQSSNYGQNWVAFNSGLGDSIITSLHCSKDGYLFVGTFNQGIFRTKEKTTLSCASNEVPLNTFELHQNYPNPFNPMTNISFKIPYKSIVLLKVFDMIGREVATIVSEELTAGNYTRQWNAANISSGVYFYRLQVGSLTETKKIVLLK